MTTKKTAENHFVTESEQQTRQVAGQLAERLGPGSVVALSGDLGAGKTVFARGLAAAFGVPEDQVHSPTFTLINEYEGDLPVYHIDCYRLESAAEALDAGMESCWEDDGVTLIEWPALIAEWLPEYTVFVEIHSDAGNERQIRVDMSRE